MTGHDRQPIQQTVQDYLRHEFLPDEDDVALTPSTPLISGGILSSIQMVKLVSFLEDRYQVRFAAHEISEDYLDTIDDIVEQISEKLPGQ